MSLINDALKKAQKQRTGETPALASMPGIGGETPQRIARRAKPAGFDTLVLRAGIGAGVALLLVVGGYFAFRSSPAPSSQLPAPSSVAQPSASVQPIQPASPKVGSPLAVPSVASGEGRAGGPSAASAPPSMLPPVSAPAAAAPAFTLPVAPRVAAPGPAPVAGVADPGLTPVAGVADPGPASPRPATSPPAANPQASRPTPQASVPAPTGSDPRVSPFRAPSSPPATVPQTPDPKPQIPVSAATAQKLEPRAIQYIENIKVAGIMARPTDSKVLMNDRVYRLGSLVEAEMNLTLVGITSNSLTFEDGNGGRYTRTF